MSSEEIFDKVKEIIVEQLGVADTAVTLEASFIDDLGADSLDIVELIMALEEEFDTELNNLLNGQNTNNSKIREMFQMLRLYKNNEFAFKEVIDERTFFENSEVVKEVVKLLEGYKIKYSHKQQFLGDFFERLLNIGVKQEAGQFFTPIPIANFICKSIDFEGIINKKIQEKY